MDKAWLSLGSFASVARSSVSASFASSRSISRAARLIFASAKPGSAAKASRSRRSPWRASPSAIRAPARLFKSPGERFPSANACWNIRLAGPCSPRSANAAPRSSNLRRGPEIAQRPSNGRAGPRPARASRRIMALSVSPRYALTIRPCGSRRKLVGIARLRRRSKRRSLRMLYASAVRASASSTGNSSWSSPANALTASRRSGSSTETARISTPARRKSAIRPLRSWSSRRQGGHQVAQKLSRIEPLRRSARRTKPAGAACGETVSRRKSGAGTGTASQVPGPTASAAAPAGSGSSRESGRLCAACSAGSPSTHARSSPGKGPVNS